MSAHSRKPTWSIDNPAAVWRHCRRAGCGAKPFIPSKADPALCQECADYYIERGRKYCSGCDRWLLRAAFSLRTSRCKACKAAAQRARRAANPERHRAKLRAERAANPEYYREAARLWKRRHPEYVKAYWKEYYACNAERLRAKRRAAYRANPHPQRARFRQRYYLLRRVFGRAR
jgi:hypothetical protein